MIQKKSPDKVIAVIAKFLQKLDAYDESPLVFVQDDINTQFKTVMDLLIGQELFSACAADQIACINCEGRASILHTGKKGEHHFARCRSCGANFRISAKEIKEFRATWLGFSGWISRIMEFSDSPEIITGNVYFLGYHNNGDLAYEVHLMKNGESDTSKQDFQAILRQKTKPVILICLASKPKPCSSKEIKIVPLLECLAFAKGNFSIVLPKRVFTGADSVKQRAAGSRWDNDPLQKQKKVLEANIRANLNSKFSPPMDHVAIKDVILSKHKDWLRFQTSIGDDTEIKEKMLNEIIKHVLTDTGQSKRIAGKYYAT